MLVFLGARRVRPVLAWALAMSVRDAVDAEDAYARMSAHVDAPKEALRALAKILVRDDLRDDASRVEAIQDFSFRGAQCLVRRWPTPAPLDSPRFAVPSLPTIADLAESLQLEVGELMWLADPRGINDTPELAHYHARWLAKRKGGRRLLEIPKRRLRAVQRQMLSWLSAVPPHASARGFRPGASPYAHAQAHVGRRWVVRVDLADFFVRVRAARVRRVFLGLGFSRGVARILTGLTTTRPLRLDDASAVERALYATRHLPQGAPTSPVLANLAAWPLDVRLDSLARSLGLTYTRYADDLVLSGRWAHPDLGAQMGATAHEEGFVVNHRKTRRMGAGRRQRVGGLIVNASVGAARADYDRLRAILHRCAKNGPVAENREGVADFRAHLRGRIEWIGAGRPHRHRKLIELFAAIRW